MGDYRLIDQPGLQYLAARLGEASVELCSIGILVGGNGSRLRLVADALESTAGDIRRRRIAVGPSVAVAAVRTDPRPFSIKGFVEASEQWGNRTEGEANNRVRTTVLWGGRHGSVAVNAYEVAGNLGTFSAAALVTDGQAEGWVGFGDWGLELGGIAAGGAHLAQVEYGLALEQGGVAGEVFVGAEAAVEGQLDLRPTDGDLGIDLGMDAFVGMGAAGSVAVGMSGASVVAGGEVGMGLGVDVDGAATYSAGRFNFDFGASAFLGVGGGFDISLEIDVAAVGSDVLEAVASATDWLASLWH